MLKFINSLATIEINKEIEAIQVVFSGSGTMQHYLETLRVATSFASLHSTHTYLLVKNEFNDINCQQFYSMMENWLHRIDEGFDLSRLHKVRVALLTNQGSYKQLCERESYQTSSKDYFYELFAFFSDEKKACSFLLAKPTNKSYQSV